MKGYRFFAEMPEDRRSKGASKRWPVAHTARNLAAHLADGSRCNCIAVDLPLSYIPGGDSVEATVAVFSHENSGVCGGGVSREYLRKRCVRVPEAVARKLHPALFRYLEADHG